MGRTQVSISAQIHASIDVVFAQLTDHEGMGAWPGVSSAHLIATGKPRNGLGAVRSLKAKGLTLHEEIVHFASPHRYDYKIVKGLPVEHLGSVRLTEDGDSVRVVWEVTMSSRIPFLAQIVGKMLRRGLPLALSYVKREAENIAADVAAEGP